MEKSVFNYNSNFQDKKTIAELKKEIERLNAENEKLKNADNTDNEIEIRTISTAEDFSQLINERLLLQDKIKLVALLNQEIKKLQSTAKNANKDIDKVEFAAKRIVKSKPVKIAALQNSLKNMFVDITDSEIEQLILELQKRKTIKIVAGKIIYP